MATLGLKEMGKFLWEGRNFPISFKPKVAIAEFFWKMQRKTWYIFHFGGGRHADFPQKPVVKVFLMVSMSA